MDYYLDIEIMPDEEVPIYFIRNKVYSKLHKALFSLKSVDIGVSFPRYKILLGDIIRIHGVEVRLRNLQATNWLGKLEGYCKISAIQKVPENIVHRLVSRKQSNMTEAKLRRLIKRDSISMEEAKRYKEKMFTKSLDNSYLELESTSNGNKYRRYINFGEISQKPHSGQFDSFGLSKTATVPWF